MADYSDRALRAFVEGIRAAARSDGQPEHAGVLDTTGSNASTGSGSDETGRSDAVPRPHYHDHRAAIDYIDDVSTGHDDQYIIAYSLIHQYRRHVDKHHYDSGPPHDNHNRFTRSDDSFHNATAIAIKHDDPKPIRDARAHIERTDIHHYTYGDTP